MKKTIYNPETLGPPVGHFDRAVRFDDWLFISGTSALTHLRGDIGDRHLVEGIEAQTHQTLDNIEKVCRAAGGSLANIYEIRMILKEREYFGIVSDIFKERIPDKGFMVPFALGVSPPIVIGTFKRRTPQANGALHAVAGRHQGAAADKAWAAEA